MPEIMKPSSNAQLRELVTTFITEHGAACDLNGIYVSGVACSDGLFSDRITKAFTRDISKWDVSSATSMTGMLKNSIFNGDI